MAEAAPAAAALLAELRVALAEAPGADPADAERLACLLAARRGFEAVVGEPPGGALATLPPPFAAVDLPAGVSARLGRRDVPAATPVDLGAGYESTIDPAARGERGQFFTPAPVADALVRWALDGVDARRPRVLDPAVGTGTFLLSALERSRIGLGGLVGVDVDATALHLAGLRLAAAAGVAAPDPLALRHASFFDVEPVGGPDDAPELGPVDAVVGNPPFVRAEALTPDADHYRRHLATFGPDGAAPLLDGPDALSRRSDAYVYFVTHATRFLHPGGRLGLVLPTKWLMSDYGEGLRAFLRERYRVDAVVGFEARAFGDALVDTALLLAERDPDAAADAPLRLRVVDGPEDLRALGADGGPTAADRTQADLTGAGSLARYLEAPSALLALLGGAPFVRLDALSAVARGTMTGANRFFLVDDEAAERFGIEDRFLRPAVKSLRSIDRPAVAGVDRWLVDVHDYVESVRDRADGADLEPAVKAALEADGHDGLRAYVAHAEAEGLHEGRTCRSRSVWFDLGPLRIPAAFVPKLLRERRFVVRNAADAVPTNAIDGLWPRDGVDDGALLAVLNASVGAAAMEVTGRDEAGLLQLMTYETASLPTLDVRAPPAPARRALAEAGEAFADRPDPETRAALDDAVDAAFDLDLPPEAIRAHAAALKRNRVDGAATVDAVGD